MDPSFRFFGLEIIPSIWTRFKNAHKHSTVYLDMKPDYRRGLKYTLLDDFRF